MAIEHKDIEDAQIHEPKHIKVSTTADAGKVITPSSTTDGESDFRKLDYSELTNTPGLPFSDYAIANVIDGSTIVSVTAATDPLLDTDGDYENITTALSSFASDTSDFGVTNPNQFTVATTGLYRIGFTLNYQAIVTSSGSGEIGFKHRVNTTYSTIKFKKGVTATSTPYTLHYEAWVNLTANDTVDFHVACTKACDVTIENAFVNVILIVPS